MRPDTDGMLRLHEAAEIMGRNFVPPHLQFEIMPYGSPTVWATYVPFTAEELERCRHTHVLYQVFPNISVYQLKLKFLLCPFRTYSEGDIKPHWYEGGGFETLTPHRGWRLFRRRPVRSSHGLEWEDQLQKVPKGERPCTAAEVLQLIFAYRHARKRTLLRNAVVRTSDTYRNGVGEYRHVLVVGPGVTMDEPYVMPDNEVADSFYGIKRDSFASRIAIPTLIQPDLPVD